MTEISPPASFDATFASALLATKNDFITHADDGTIIRQHGAAQLDATGFPGWPEGLTSTEPVIETYVANDNGIVALSNNEPYVSTWQPLLEWMDERVRSSLADEHVELAGDAYATASLTATDLLEGMAHMDDDTFVPTDSVSLVAIFGQLAGPRVATEPIDHALLRPMSQIVFADEQLDRFAADGYSHTRCEADQLVIFPQFGQLHAGPAASHVAGLAPARQLLVYRAAVACRRLR